MTLSENQQKKKRKISSTQIHNKYNPQNFQSVCTCRIFSAMLFSISEIRLST
ncbi:hypothetical protein HanXRQr2_Chr04g0155571 [Helianthus annuus]|uniref:Uncharacterized protein n=1 Tax=Helianthus annuus TaxID=4232 RepID=A0A9K3J5T6_HELAN|nr:hypothetical protein HanXRQr2_Chr04g0155571 [Helianthus annuus]KAJ0930462.1 hypothetical protein HanPSC8_Chr04g0149581 [Helianthus annuus]